MWRRYAYRVADQPQLVDPLERGHVLSWSHPLDLDAMNAAAQHLLGEHDFAAFCRKRQGATTIRTLLDLRWEREPTGIAVATVRADAFCHTMVRSLVGALIAVGEGRQERAWPAEVLTQGQPRPGREGEPRPRPDPRGGGLPTGRRPCCPRARSAGGALTHPEPARLSRTSRAASTS